MEPCTNLESPAPNCPQQAIARGRETFLGTLGRRYRTHVLLTNTRRTDRNKERPGLLVPLPRILNSVIASAATSKQCSIYGMQACMQGLQKGSRTRTEDSGCTWDSSCPQPGTGCSCFPEGQAVQRCTC